MASEPLRRRWNPIGYLLDLLDAHVTARADARAQEMGLTIIRVPGTRTQVYRDPRFDRRRLCGTCAGTGRWGMRGCDRCDGWGVVTTGPALEAGEQP